MYNYICIYACTYIIYYAATPKEWEKMPINLTSGKEEVVHIVDLNSTSQEYQDIKKRFDSSMQSNQLHQGTLLTHSSILSPSPKNVYNSIITIQRIQNPTLHSQYIARKKEMDKQNPHGCQNERLLFHGTKPETCPKINHGGFNRSYCGQNGKICL